jgi:NADH:ubiquinone oxidoreductase subunit H
MPQDLAIALVYIGYALAVLLTLGAVLTWVERKQAAIMSDRIGANRAYVRIPFTQIKLIWLGLFHGMADGLKLLLKEDFKPLAYDKLAYRSTRDCSSSSRSAASRSSARCSRAGRPPTSSRCSARCAPVRS